MRHLTSGLCLQKRCMMTAETTTASGAIGVGRGGRMSRQRKRNANQVRRLLALAAIYDGASRAEAAEIGGVTRQIIRDWVLKFNTDGPDGLIDRKAPGQPSRLNETHRTALAAAIESGPIPAVHGVVRWRIADLCQWLWDEFRVSVSKQTLGRELRAMRYRKLSARPRHHGQAEGAIEEFKKSLPETLASIAREQGVDAAEIEVWFGDEARLGQKNKITRGWARRGTRPSAPRDPPHRIGLYFRCDLSGPGKSRRADPAMVQYRGDEPPTRRDLGQSHAWPTRGAAAGSGGMAHHAAAHRALQHQHRSATGQMSRAQCTGERLAVPA